MVFASLPFILIFLPICLAVYPLLKKQFQNLFLLIASLLFYAYGTGRFVFVLICSIAVSYILALLIKHYKKQKERLAKLFVSFGVLFSVGILFYYKYLNFFAETINNVVFENEWNLNGLDAIVMPIGISFFSFQAISYIVDVYKDDTLIVEKNPINVALYICFFPQLIAGPIIKYSSISKQINERYISIQSYSDGIKRFVMGFAKKVLLANTFAIVADDIYRNLGDGISVGSAWLCTISYTLQIYYDFSGYSDMAIGLGKMFGFDFEENFNFPYMAKSATDFWRRWHISLSSWFKEYVYIPLGGSRKGVYRQIVNLFVVWCLTGIWHGAGGKYLLWGLMWFLVLLIEKNLIKPEKKNKIFVILWQISTLFIVNFTWVLFRSSDIQETLLMLCSMFGSGKSRYLDDVFWRYGREYLLYFIVGILLATDNLNRILNYFRKKNTVFEEIFESIVILLLFVFALSKLVMGGNNPFIYFNF